MPRNKDENTFSYLAKLEQEDEKLELQQKMAEENLIKALNSCSLESRQQYANLLRH
jgi:hypothetical protein